MSQVFIQIREFYFPSVHLAGWLRPVWNGRYPSTSVCFIVWLETITFINHTICKRMEWNDTNEHDEYSIDDRLQPSPKEDALLDTEIPVVLTIFASSISTNSSINFCFII